MNNIVSYMVCEKKKIAVTLLYLMFFTVPSFSSMALGLSTYRIYLDNDNRQEDFVVYSNDQYTQNCKLFLRHYDIQLDGSKIAVDLDIIPAHSAQVWMRFSPKRFSVKPGTSQAVKFQIRRKANSTAQEYRSFLSIDCESDKTERIANNDVNVNISPRLRHNVPIIVRTGKLDAEINFENIQLKNGTISVNVNRSGNRSIHGKIELVDTRNNEVISKEPLFTLYTETFSKTVYLATKGIQKDYLELRFKEDPNIGGKIVVNQKLL
jgi:fimbrial chaperone protein